AVYVIAAAAADCDNLALFEKGVRRGHGLIEQPAGIVAQVEDNAAQLAGAALFQISHRVRDRTSGLLAETGDADITDIAAFEMPAHRLSLDLCADQRQLKGFPPGASSPKGHLAFDRAPHLPDRFGQRQTLDW